MKSSVFFDFVCESHLENFEHRYGIDFKNYRAQNTKWRIWEYNIQFCSEIEQLEVFKVYTRIVELDGDRKKVSFRFMDFLDKTEYAKGFLTYRFQNILTKEYIPIWESDLTSFVKDLQI